MLKRTFISTTQTNGNGPIKTAWQPESANFVATAGASPYVNILDRKGHIVANIPVQGDTLDLKWTHDGELLAILQSKSSQIILWDAKSASISFVETGMKFMDSMAWSLDNQILAVATGKGNLFLYEHFTGKKTPVIGKHTKAITGLTWTFDSILICVSNDKSMTGSNAAGDTLFQVGLKADPSLLRKTKVVEKNRTQTIISLVFGGRAFFIHRPDTPNAAPIEMAFNAKYGNIVKYEWFRDGLALITFDTGHMIVISAREHEMGQEQFQSKIYKDFICDMTISKALNVAATCGDNVIKLHDLTNLQDVSSIITFENEAVSLDKIHFSDDGQFLTVTTKNGMMYAYLSRLPLLGHTFGTRVAYLTSVTDVSILDFGSNPNGFAKCENQVEPSKVSLGPGHVAIINGTTATFSELVPTLNQPRDTITYQYPSAVSEAVPFGLTGRSFSKNYGNAIVSLQLSSNFAACLLNDGELQLHPIDEECFSSTTPPLSMVYPEDAYSQTQDGAVVEISCASMTENFMIYGTSNGSMLHYDLDELAVISEFKHPIGIKALFPQPGLGVRVLFVDDELRAHIMSPLNGESYAVSNWSEKTLGALWDTTPPVGRSIFVSWDQTHITTHVFSPHTLKGPQSIALMTFQTRLPTGNKPVLMMGSRLICQTPGGKLDSITLASHEDVTVDAFLKKYPLDVDQGRGLRSLYMLGKMNVLWGLYPEIKSRKAWTMVAEAALHVLDTHTATRIYRQILEDVGMVRNLERISAIEDRAESAGHLAVIFGDFSTAQHNFLTSSNQEEALKMRRDLQEWDQALNLATKLAPEQVTVISREYGFQLELDGKASEAFAMYQKAIETAASCREPIQEHMKICTDGLTRMTFRLGDISRGMVFLKESNDRVLLFDCAVILEALKQYSEAASLMERGGYFEQAADLWIRIKNWSRVSKILDKVSSPKIFAQYAKAQENEGSYAEAARAYEKANDYDSVARVLVDHLKDVEAAAHLIRKTRSRESARMLSKHFLAQRNFAATIEFYLISGQQNEAFDLARAQGTMDPFAEGVKEDASLELLTQIATYYESKEMYMKAGKFHLHALRYPEALKMFLLSPSADGISIDFAIETVGLAKNDSLTHELIDYLMGETDGIPKDAKYIFKLYMSLGQFREAARTAIIIAREEQVLGNYRAAHDLLLDNYRQLQKTKAKIPSELDHMLMLLHSYTLVKTHVRLEDHEKGARMLIRVSNNISKFPAHVVPILTSCVIECHRSDLKKEAFDFAAILMRPENRNKMDPKFRKKIEQIVRRPEKNDPVPEPLSPCPFCETMIPETALDCTECKNHIPYCIASGHHMTLEGWSICGECYFPAIERFFRPLIEDTGKCPMCSADIGVNRIEHVENPKEYLTGRKANLEEYVPEKKPAVAAISQSALNEDIVYMGELATAAS